MSYSPLGYPRSCRFCGLGFPMVTEPLEVVPVDRGAGVLGRRWQARQPSYQHPSCAADEAQAHEAAELVRNALYAASSAAARAGRLDDAAALIEAAGDVLVAHYRQRATA